MKNIIYQVLFLLFFSFLSFSQEPAKLLTSTNFNNGEPIPEAKTASEWEQLSMSNQPVFMKKVIVGKEYFFYNWYAISDKRQLVDEKWMIPNSNELLIWNAYSPISVQPIGIISEQGAFSKVAEQQYFWTCSEYTDKGKRESAVSVSISKTNIGETEIKQAYKQEGFLVWIVEKEKMSIAIKEATKLLLETKRLSSTFVNNTTKTETNPTTGNITTTSITEYKSVKIGNQTWMTENLNTDRFRNGDLIPEAKTTAEWELADKEGKPTWCYYLNDSINDRRYGKLYNWYAVNDSRILAPKGWHVSSNIDWVNLSDFLGGDDVSGKKLKNTFGWSSNGNGNNISSFSGFPGGFRFSNGDFYYLGFCGYWWTSSESNTKSAFFVGLEHKNNRLQKSENNKGEGFSVRCIQD
jgi:uncharacterized protein (TIGR02145 family)